VAGAVIDEGDQAFRFPQKLEDLLDYIDVPFFLPAADVVDLSGFFFLNDKGNRLAVVLDEEPAPPPGGPDLLDCLVNDWVKEVNSLLLFLRDDLLSQAFLLFSPNIPTSYHIYFIYPFQRLVASDRYNY
jgi:hypothetical protein